jgi:phenylpropionate dioxygenase-like ring-hydroxylating dioxygenase large terminal subunit
MEMEFRKVRNQTTQPVREFPIFNNWQVVALGWYFAGRKDDVKVGQVHSINLCGQDLVLWRDSKGKLSCLDAYCPHMGTHLGKGKVVSDRLQCFFHHWKYDGNGSCVEIPCQKEIPTRARVRSYFIEEKFDAIWVYPGDDIPRPLVDFDEITGEELMIRFGKPYKRSCHHHVTMINGIDPQHLKTVHNLDVEMAIDIQEDQERKIIDISLLGGADGSTTFGKWVQRLLGPDYGYSMRYDHANNGFLTLMKSTRLFGRLPLPPLHMIFAYRPEETGRTFVQPIYVTRRRPGILGWFANHSCLILTWMGFQALQSEDGEVYENMRFFPANLLPIDRPVANYIQYVNRLEPSPWRL